MTTTGKTLDPELMLIDHLDLNPGCEVHSRRSETPGCDQAADWWAILRHHCRPDSTIQAFWCAEHHDKAMAEDPFLCRFCSEPINLKPLIIRTERIR